MPGKKVPIKNLYPGQIVTIANCVGTFEIIKRVGKNLYRVILKGQEITVTRNAIGVNVHGTYRIGPFNEAK